MKENDISRATLGRIPMYLKFLNSLPEDIGTVSATTVARELGLGEVQVRKDLGALCGSGKPKIGYTTESLKASLESFLDKKNGGAVIIGAGKLGRALLDYGGFSDYGMDITAAFDKNVTREEHTPAGKLILPMSRFDGFCRENGIKLGIIAVPADAAQEVCNLLCDSGIKAIWCFAPCQLYKPAEVIIQYENLALSLAHLKMQISR